MIIAAYLLFGILLGLALVLYVERWSRDAPRALSSVLLIAAGIYVAFAMASMETTWLVVELAGLGIVGVFLFLAGRRGLGWLAAAWAAHPLWDVGVHTVTGVAFVPAWYPILCVTFDLVVALYIVRNVRAGSWRTRREVAG